MLTADVVKNYGFGSFQTHFPYFGYTDIHEVYNYCEYVLLVHSLLRQKAAQK